MIQNLLSHQPATRPERSPTDSALVAKSIPNIEVSRYPKEERQDFTSILHAIAMDYDLNDERQQSSHRRSHPSSLPRHRRSLALTNDEFTEITLLCVELHGDLHHEGDAAVWDGFKADGSRF